MAVSLSKKNLSCETVVGAAGKGESRGGRVGETTLEAGRRRAEASICNMTHFLEKVKSATRIF